MRRKQTRSRLTTYSHWDELFASATEPLSVERRTHQLTRMYQALHQLETADNPKIADWRVVSDAVNMLETLVMEMNVCEDSSGLLMEAVTAMAAAGHRHKHHGKPIRLDGPGIQAVRAVLASYAEIIETLPARAMIRCHRLTEKRLHAILDGRKQSHDVQIL